jgi:hypothetical protein
MHPSPGGRERSTAARLPAEMRTPPEELLVGGQDEHAPLLLARSPMPGRAAPPFLLIHGTAEGWCGTRKAPYSRKHWPRPECRYGWFP